MKIDHKKQLPTYAARRGRFDLVQVPALNFLMIDGAGDPDNGPAYRDAIGAIYPLAYKLKFLSRAELGLDYVVMPLEALWWADDMASFTTARDKSRWSWTLMTMVPQGITAAHLAAAQAAVSPAAGHDGSAAVRLERLDEGLCVQTLHVGPYDDEAPVLAAIHDEFIPAHGLRMTSRHHEIYLSDARRTAPEKLRTILRQPVVAAD